MTLTQTAALTKKALVGFVGFIFLIIFGFIGYKLYYNLYFLPHQKPVLEQPDVKFGILPKLNLPEATSSATYTYSLDTTTGTLPNNLPRLAKVYFVPQLGTTLLAPDKISNLSNLLGFSIGPTVVNDTEYHFSDPLGGTLTIDLNSGNLSFERPATDSATLTDRILGSQDQLVKDFKNYLGAKGLFNDSLNTGRTSVSYNGNANTDSTQADVSIWPNDLEKNPVVTPNYNKALINTTMTKSDVENYRFVKMQYIFWTPDLKSASTYPLKPIQTAFDELQNAQGFVSVTPPTSQASITQIYLGYLETESYTPYIQPVYVFQGPNFVAYIPAINSQYSGK